MPPLCQQPDAQLEGTPTGGCARKFASGDTFLCGSLALFTALHLIPRFSTMSISTPSTRYSISHSMFHPEYCPILSYPSVSYSIRTRSLPQESLSTSHNLFPASSFNIIFSLPLRLVFQSLPSTFPSLQSRPQRSRRFAKSRNITYTTCLATRLSDSYSRTSKSPATWKRSGITANCQRGHARVVGAWANTFPKSISRKRESFIHRVFHRYDVPRFFFPISASLVLSC